MNASVVAAHDARSCRQTDPGTRKLIRRVQALQRIEQIAGVLHVKTGTVGSHKETHAAIDEFEAQLDTRVGARGATFRSAIPRRLRAPGVPCSHPTFRPASA